MNTNKNLLGTLFLAIGVFACTFSAHAVIFANLVSKGAMDESSEMTGYKAYYCSASSATTIFGEGNDTIAKITAYLTKNMASYNQGMANLADPTKGGVAFDATPTFDPDDRKYTFYKDLPSLDTGDYFAVLAYAASEENMVRVFNSSTLTYQGENSVTFDPDIKPFGGTAGDWTTVSVPEPTSGMLLLLGFAGLALKRKRA